MLKYLEGNLSFSHYEYIVVVRVPVSASGLLGCFASSWVWSALWERVYKVIMYFRTNLQMICQGTCINANDTTSIVTPSIWDLSTLVAHLGAHFVSYASVCVVWSSVKALAAPLKKISRANGSCLGAGTGNMKLCRNMWTAQPHLVCQHYTGVCTHRTSCSKSPAYKQWGSYRQLLPHKWQAGCCHFRRKKEETKKIWWWPLNLSCWIQICIKKL